jgi:hypothetical protein
MRSVEKTVEAFGGQSALAKALGGEAQVPPTERLSGSCSGSAAKIGKNWPRAPRQLRRLYILNPARQNAATNRRMAETISARQS